MDENLELKEIKKRLEKNFDSYWTRITGIVDDYETENGIKIKKDNKAEIKKLKQLIKDWEEEIEEYCDEIREYFNLEYFDETDVMVYEYQEFKDNIFAEVLWTVSSALRNAAFDEEMVRYRESFLRTSAADIFMVVKNILTKTRDYINNYVTNINYNRINKIEHLKVEFLTEEEMLLSGVIGYGIRSEILHRLYPGHFGMMTRRSIWAMYYFSNEAEEFITDEKSVDDKKQRTSHDWEYDYLRFLFYQNFIANLLEAKLNKYNISIKRNFRFGYVNLFLNQIYYLHKEEIDVLYKWQSARM
ncbi:MAG: hypothetical protein ACOCRK_04310 [bacterium]